MAKFEKQFMSISELRETGLPKDVLARLSKIPESGAHQELGPNGKEAKNGKYIFDTERLARYLDDHVWI